MTMSKSIVRGHCCLALVALIVAIQTCNSFTIPTASPVFHNENPLHSKRINTALLDATKSCGSAENHHRRPSAVIRKRLFLWKQFLFIKTFVLKKLKFRSILSVVVASFVLWCGPKAAVAAPTAIKEALSSAIPTAAAATTHSSRSLMTGGVVVMLGGAGIVLGTVRALKKNTSNNKNIDTVNDKAPNKVDEKPIGENITNNLRRDVAIVEQQISELSSETTEEHAMLLTNENVSEEEDAGPEVGTHGEERKEPVAQFVETEEQRPVPIVETPIEAELDATQEVVAFEEDTHQPITETPIEAESYTNEEDVAEVDTHQPVTETPIEAELDTTGEDVAEVDTHQPVTETPIEAELDTTGEVVAFEEDTHQPITETPIEAESYTNKKDVAEVDTHQPITETPIEAELDTTGEVVVAAEEETHEPITETPIEAESYTNEEVAAEEETHQPITEMHIDQPNTETQIEAERNMNGEVVAEVDSRESYVESREKARQQPRSPSEEEALSAKYGAIESLEQRAFQILVDLRFFDEPPSTDE
jgi:hypothetical protein